MLLIELRQGNKLPVNQVSLRNDGVKDCFLRAKVNHDNPVESLSVETLLPQSLDGNVLPCFLHIPNDFKKALEVRA